MLVSKESVPITIKKLTTSKGKYLSADNTAIGKERGDLPKK